jgi:hypothetical protein
MWFVELRREENVTEFLLVKKKSESHRSHFNMALHLDLKFDLVLILKLKSESFVYSY